MICLAIERLSGKFNVISNSIKWHGKNKHIFVSVFHFQIIPKKSRTEDEHIAVFEKKTRDEKSSDDGMRGFAGRVMRR